MSQTPSARMLGLQPPLPLIDPDQSGDDHPTTSPDAEWRLDEHTREVGRRGIAEARARLQAASGARRRTTERGPGGGTPDHAPGRAA